MLTGEERESIRQMLFDSDAYTTGRDDLIVAAIVPAIEAIVAARVVKMTDQVPRVASSLDDLRVGQVVAIGVKDYGIWHLAEILIVDKAGCAGGATVELSSTSEQVGFGFSEATWVILESEPVTVSREAFDRLDDALRETDKPMKAGAETTTVDAYWLESLGSAARALVDEVRGQTDVG